MTKCISFKRIITGIILLLCLKRIEEVRQFFSEKNYLTSEDISFAYKLAIDCHDHINPKHKYEMELGNFLEI